LKNFKFKQDNNFGDSLEMIATGYSKEEVSLVIRNWIVENTRSKEEQIELSNNLVNMSYNQRKNEYKKYLNANVTRKKSQKDLDSDAYKFLHEKFYCSEKNCYSLNDFENKYDEIKKEFAEENAKRTYIWHFDNDEYDLTEIVPDVPGVLDVRFVYCE